MSPHKFRDDWLSAGDKLVRFSSQALKNINLSSETKQFLSEAGLPPSAAPFLSFELPLEEQLAPVTIVWDLSENYERYKMIGFNGFGDPICIDDEKEERIIYLNHDNEFEVVLINSSLFELAASLIIYRDFVKKIREQRGEAAYLKKNIPPELISWIGDELAKIDPEALNQQSFWQEAIDELRN